MINVLEYAKTFPFAVIHLDYIRGDWFVKRYAANERMEAAAHYRSMERARVPVRLTFYGIKIRETNLYPYYNEMEKVA